jgi:hypothetical protein
MTARDDAYERWCEFTDEAELAPDTRMSAEDLAKRYNRRAELGGAMTAERVRELMPEASDQRKGKL